MIIDMHAHVVAPPGLYAYKAGLLASRGAHQTRNNPRRENFDDSLKRMYFDLVLSNKESTELCLKMVGVDRCMFGTEKLGTGSAQDPATGAWLDDLKPVIESIEWLTAEDKKQIFEDNVKVVFPRFKVPAAATV